MQGLRTVTVLEHEIIPIIDGQSSLGILPDRVPWISEAEAQALLALNELRRGFCQRLSGGIKLAQHCGIVRLPTCVVEVLPKMGMLDARVPDEVERSRSALLAMLHSARRVAITQIGPVPQQVVTAPLLDVFIEAFLHCALRQARRGLMSRYVVHVEDLPVIKGRFQVHRHFRRNQASPHLVHCEYDEFTADNAYNRAVRATLEACRTWISSPSTQRLWFEALARYAGISARRMTAADVADLPRDRTTNRYDALLTWCEWLLAMASPALTTGTSQAPGLLFDMNKLFEAHAVRLEEAGAASDCIVKTQGPVLHLATNGQNSVFLLKPDISVWKVGPDGSVTGIDRVVDAKWKRLDPHAPDFGVAQADVYQLLAYAVRYGCNSLELVYPQPDRHTHSKCPPSFRLQADGLTGILTIKVKLLPLWLTASHQIDHEFSKPVEAERT